MVGGRAGTGVCAVGSWGGGIGVWALGSLGKGRERNGTESGKRKLLLNSKGTSILKGERQEERDRKNERRRESAIESEREREHERE